MNEEMHPHGDWITVLWQQARQAGVTRRKFLALLAIGGAAAILAACGKTVVTSTTTVPTKPATTSSTAKPTGTSAAPPPPGGGGTAQPPPPAGGGAPPPPPGGINFTPPPPPYSSGKMVITSPVVKDGGVLGDKYTCNGVNSGVYEKAAQFPFSWTGAPAGTKSFAVFQWNIRGGGDEGIWWILYNIPPNVTSLPEDVKGIGLVGLNDQGIQEYNPPCGGGPGTFKRYTVVYALSDMLNLPDPSKVDATVFRAAVKDITLDSATLTTLTII